MWSATHRVWYRYLHLVLCRGSLGVWRKTHWEFEEKHGFIIRKCTRCSTTDVLHISQTSMSACCPGSVRMLNVWTPKEATGAHVNQATCWTLKASTVSVSIITLSVKNTSNTSFKTVAFFFCIALEYDGHFYLPPQRTRQCLTRGRCATDRCQQAHALCHLPNTSPSRFAAAAEWARPGALGAIAVLCRDQVQPPKVTPFLLLHVSSIVLRCSYTV